MRRGLGTTFTLLFLTALAFVAGTGPVRAEDKPAAETPTEKSSDPKAATKTGAKSSVLTAPKTPAEKGAKEKKPVKDAKSDPKTSGKSKASAAEAAAPAEKFVAKVQVLVAKPAKGEGDTKVAKAALGLAQKNWSKEKSGRVSVQIDEVSDTSAEALKKFFGTTASDAVVSLLPGDPKLVEELVKLAEETGTPVLGAKLPARSVLGRGHAMTFYTTAEQATAAEAQKRGYKNIARISTTDPSIESLRESFDTAHAGRIRRVMDEEFSADTQDFSSYIEQLKGKKDVDAVMVLLAQGQAGVFAAQLRKAGLKTPIFGFSSLGNAADIKAAGGGLSGAWYVSIGEPTDSFSKSFQNASGISDDAATYLAAQVYDALSLIASGAEKASNREGINQSLHTVKDYRGAFGTYSANSATNSFTLPVAVKTIGQK